MLALQLSIAVAVVYLAVLRLLDLNEREPLWVLILLFVLGFGAAGVLRITVPSSALELTVIGGAAAEALATFAALLVGVFVITVAGRARGFSELNGLMDGLVYGGAVGLGFATGEVFVRDLVHGASDLFAPPFLTLLWTSALAGLAHGVFGALIGIGIAGAAHASALPRRLVFTLAGLGAGLGANALHRVLAYGNALGASGAVRAWVALLLPLLLVAAVAVYALSAERRAILEELEAERLEGAVLPDELALLRSPSRRQGLYLRTVLQGHFVRATALRTLHVRQVQLALAKRRAADARDERQRARLTREADTLRSAVMDRRNRLLALDS
jgi:RsiW-degrading membrane proteinase PrsW (M82 family)